MRSTVAGIICLMFVALTAAAPPATAQTTAPTTTNAQPAQLSGQVLDAVSGRPVRGALIGMADLGQWTMADANGTFRLTNVPPGHQELVVRALGYSPVQVRTQFMASDSLTMQVVLTPVPPTLGTVRVEAEFEEQYARQLRQFEESRSLGAGRFLDWRFFDEHQDTRLSTLLHGRFGALRAGTSQLEVTRSDSPCLPQTYVNGVLRPDGVILDQINTAEVLGFEFYTPATTPARYNATGPRSRSAVCGTVVFWLK